ERRKLRRHAIGKARRDAFFVGARGTALVLRTSGRRREHDVGVVGHGTIRRARARRRRGRRLAPWRALRGYLAQSGSPQAPAALGAHVVVAFSGIAGVQHWVFRNEAGETSVAIRPRLIVTTAEAALDAVRAHFGITRVLSYQAADDIARGSLRRLLSAHEGDELPIHLLYPGGRHPPPKLRAFLDFARPRLRRRCEAIIRAIRS